jgi:hypothetical protein
LKFRFGIFAFSAQEMGIKSLRLKLIIKDSPTDVIQIFIIVVFVEGILLEGGIFILYGHFVAIHTLSFKLIKNKKFNYILIKKMKRDDAHPTMEEGFERGVRSYHEDFFVHLASILRTPLDLSY